MLTNRSLYECRMELRDTDPDEMMNAQMNVTDKEVSLLINLVPSSPEEIEQIIPSLSRFNESSLGRLVDIIDQYCDDGEDY